MRSDSKGHLPTPNEDINGLLESVDEINNLGFDYDEISLLAFSEIFDEDDISDSEGTLES